MSSGGCRFIPDHQEWISGEALFGSAGSEDPEETQEVPRLFLILRLDLVDLTSRISSHLVSLIIHWRPVNVAGKNVEPSFVQYILYCNTFRFCLHLGISHTDFDA